MIPTCSSKKGVDSLHNFGVTPKLCYNQELSFSTEGLQTTTFFTFHKMYRTPRLYLTTLDRVVLLRKALILASEQVQAEKPTVH